MNKLLSTLIFAIAISSCNAQAIDNNKDKIEKAQKELNNVLNAFFSKCILEKSCTECVDNLVAEAKDEYQMYIVGGALYNIDADRSFDLHEKAIKKRPNELGFNLEYAIELHRKGDYKNAIPYYLTYKNIQPNDYRVDVWLSECYLNLDNYSKAIDHWKKANHPRNHTGIDQAIYIIHGRSDQIKERSALIDKVKAKDKRSAYDLIYQDANWELDWWNSNIQEYFLNKDLELVKESLGEQSKEYAQLKAYSVIKRLSGEYGNTTIDSIKATLLTANLIINGQELPAHGKIASDMLRIAFLLKILEEKEFFQKRGNELIKLADQLNDSELLNIYAYLEAVTNGHVSEATDKKGWEKYKDERFAISYFMGLADKNRYNNPELEKAIKDFPYSSKLHWVKLNCAKIEGKNLKADLIAVMKKEFKTLNSDQSRYSYALKSYFYLLENNL